MKKCLLLLLLAGCAAPSQKVPAAAEEIPYTPLPAGTLVATDSFRHSDGLNDFLFKIKVEAATAVGLYNIAVSDGPRDAQNQLEMPKGGETLPIFVKAEPPEAFVVGFRMPADTTFYPYFRIGLEGTTITMKYVKVYTFR